MYVNFKPRLKTFSTLLQCLENSQICLNFETVFSPNHMHVTMLNVLFAKPETAAMFFPVPKQTAPCLALLVHSNESGRRFDMDTCAVPPCGHRARSPFLSFLCGVEHVPCAKVLPPSYLRRGPLVESYTLFVCQHPTGSFLEGHSKDTRGWGLTQHAPITKFQPLTLGF